MTALDLATLFSCTVAGIFFGLVLAVLVIFPRIRPTEAAERRDPQIAWLLQQNAWMARIISSNLSVEPPQEFDDEGLIGKNEADAPPGSCGHEETEAQKADIFGWHRGART